MEQEIKSKKYMPSFEYLVDFVEKTTCQMNEDGFILTSISHAYSEKYQHSTVMVFTKN